MFLCVRAGDFKIFLAALFSEQYVLTAQDSLLTLTRFSGVSFYSLYFSQVHPVVSLEISKWVQRYGVEPQIVPLDLQTPDPR